MKNLEKFIIENKDLIMNDEPAKGHVERFEKLLSKQNARKRIIQLSYRISRVAAVGILLVMSSLWAYNEFFKPDYRIMALGEINKEYQEIEFFFTSQINSKFDELKTIDIPGEEDYKMTMIAGLNEMDSVYTKLQKEMGANPGDTRIIEAMIRHYQTKLQVMTEILNRLKSYKEYINPKTNNQNQYESVKI